MLHAKVALRSVRIAESRINKRKYVWLRTCWVHFIIKLTRIYNHSQKDTNNNFTCIWNNISWIQNTCLNAKERKKEISTEVDKEKEGTFTLNSFKSRSHTISSVQLFFFCSSYFCVLHIFVFSIFCVLHIVSFFPINVELRTWLRNMSKCQWKKRFIFQNVWPKQVN